MRHSIPRRTARRLVVAALFLPMLLGAAPPEGLSVEASGHYAYARPSTFCAGASPRPEASGSARVRYRHANGVTVGAGAGLHQPIDGTEAHPPILHATGGWHGEWFGAEAGVRADLRERPELLPSVELRIGSRDVLSFETALFRPEWPSPTSFAVFDVGVGKRFEGAELDAGLALMSGATTFSGWSRVLVPVSPDVSVGARGFTELSLGAERVWSVGGVVQVRLDRFFAAQPGVPESQSSAPE